VLERVTSRRYCRLHGREPRSSGRDRAHARRAVLRPIGTVTHVQRADGRVTVQTVTAKPLDEVTVLIQDAVTAAGYRPAGIDSEDSEAEVFFTSGSYAAGQARVRRAGCQSQWNIDLDLTDPNAGPHTDHSPGDVRLSSC
jgi:hypothetical protein